MRMLGIGLLSLFRRISLWIRRMRGQTEDEAAARRVVGGEAWNEFCDTLKAAGAALQFPGAPQDSFNQAEGYRYLSRIARAGLMAFVEPARRDSANRFCLVRGAPLFPRRRFRSLGGIHGLPQAG